MVYGQTLANDLGAMSAHALLLGNDLGANSQPASSPVSLGSANPIRSICPGQVLRPKKPTAVDRAEVAPAAALTQHPRLSFKRLPALFAGQFNGGNPSGVSIASDLFRGKGIGWANARPPFVPELMRVHHYGMRIYDPATLARPATEPHSSVAALSSRKGCTTLLASEVDHRCHGSSIPRFTGTGTMLTAARRLSQQAMQLEAR